MPDQPNQAPERLTQNPQTGASRPVPRGPILVLVGLIVILGLVGYFFRSTFLGTTTVTHGYSEKDVALHSVPNYGAIKARYGLNLTATQEAFLDQHKFLLVDPSATNLTPSVNFDQMLTDFDSIGSDPADRRKPEDTKLVTPDIVLHAYHRYFDMTLEELEQHELTTTLDSFLTNLQSNLTTSVQASTGVIKDRYQNLEAQILLARVLFENKSPAKPDSFDNTDQEQAYTTKDATIDSVDNAKAILAKESGDLPAALVAAIQTDLDKIYMANSVEPSALFGQYSDTQKTDFTQFTPRSHYTKNSTLRAYFRTMMYLGRSSYFLKKDVGLMDANLLTKEFTAPTKTGSKPVDDWQKLMTVTSFYAGQSDDLTYTEWNQYLKTILGAGASNDTNLTDPASIQKLGQHLDQLPQLKILSDVVVDPAIEDKTKADLLRESLSFRIFGQRFTFDAWVLNDLTAGQEQTDVKLPSTPSALFIPAAFGDTEARTQVQTFLQKDAGFTPAQVTGFLTKLDLKQADIGKVKQNEWFASINSAWLYVLGALTHTYNTTYPKYMQSTNFLDKQIGTFLGSYTELKHDTLLYAKQSYAEKGGGGDLGPLPPIVKGFVEPNLDFWQRFNRLLDQTAIFFNQNKLFADQAESDRLADFSKTSLFYEQIAKEEMAGTPISDDEYEQLRTTDLSFMAQPFEALDPDENSAKTALIADVHTDAIKSQILYEATGKPYLMLAIVGNENSPRVVAGLVYNHYEFTNPLGKRLTDEDWRTKVYDQTTTLPAKNFWYQSLAVK